MYVAMSFQNIVSCFLTFIAVINPYSFSKFKNFALHTGLFTFYMYVLHFVFSTIMHGYVKAESSLLLYGICLIMILMLAVLAKNNTYTKSPWRVVCDFNQYTATLTLH